MTSMDVSLEVGPFRLTRHARERAVERSIPLEVVWIVIFHGMPVRDERGDATRCRGFGAPVPFRRGSGAKRRAWSFPWIVTGASPR
jgi:hypothetical protein